MKVRAIALGFYGGHRRRPGDVFDFAGEKLASWMEPATRSDHSVNADEAPRTLSAITRQAENVERAQVRKKGGDIAG